MYLYTHEKSMVRLRMVYRLAQWGNENTIQDDCRARKHSIIAHQIDQCLSKQHLNLWKQPAQDSCGIQIMRGTSPCSAAVSTYFES